jgi:dihydrofolate reductase
MAKIVLYMAMSLDGFIAGPDDGLGGVNGNRLHDWLTGGEEVQPGDRDPEPRHLGFTPTSAASAQVFDEVMSTGAVIAGRRLYEITGGWGGDHHDGVPIFVPTHEAPEGKPPGRVRFVTDGIESCVAQAKAAAVERDVLLHGAITAQECLRAGLLDEMAIQLVPVLLGDGRRLFEGLGPDLIELELVRTLEAHDVTHLRYRVQTR